MNKLRITILAILTLGLLFGEVGSPVVSVAAGTRAGSCGVWRWLVKTLSDPARRQVHFHPRQTKVAKMRKWNGPGRTLSTSTPRFGSVEFHTWTVKARPIQAKLEDDKDIHLVISVPAAPSKTMIVEFPKPICVKSAFKRSKIAAARNRFLSNCGSVSSSSWSKLTGQITLVGVGFWDEKHGQTGVAPNGVELHPVLNIMGDCHKRTGGGGGGGDGSDCDPSYPTVCIPPPPPDLDCGDISYRNFKVVPPDPHNFDGDHDGVGCET